MNIMEIPLGELGFGGEGKGGQFFFFFFLNEDSYVLFIKVNKSSGL